MITYWNRKTRREDREIVYGDAGVKFLYKNPFGHFLVNQLLSRKLPSSFYGFYQNLAVSRKKIDPFIEKFQIPMEEFENKDFSNFNDFFTRKFKPGARTFEQDPRKLAAPAEARYLAFDGISSALKFPVKGVDLTPEVLLGSRDVARSFEGGALLIARLCPVDYHRFHYPDDGRTWDSYRIHGKFHSVNPLALEYRSEIFFTNERQVSLLDTKNFGRIAYIEVGALCVGKIIQTHIRPDFHRGDEKGYFLFGASTVILLGQQGIWKPSSDLLEKTAEHKETLVRLGEPIGQLL